MDIQDVVHLRLQNHHLSQPSFKSPTDVVRYLGAVQAQDYHAAKWSVSLRMQDARDVEIESAYNDGLILRTHVMRPTWHFVMPEDISWMLEHTSPHVKKPLLHYDRKLEITEEVILQTQRIIRKALEREKYLTREEIAIELEKHDIPARGQRLGHIVAHAELDALICSGPRRGKQFTYALLEDRVPKTKKISRDEALARLATSYITSHGPVQIKDFSWWSGFSVKDATAAFSMVDSKFTKETIDEKTYWFAPYKHLIKQDSPNAYLLSVFDEYTIAYKDRSALDGEKYFAKMISMGNAFLTAMIIDGIVVGSWRREVKKDTIEIQLKPFRELKKSEIDAFEKAAKRYGKFHNKKIKLLRKYEVI